MFYLSNRLCYTNNIISANNTSVISNPGVCLSTGLWVGICRIPPITTVPQQGAPGVVACAGRFCAVVCVPFMAYVHKRKLPFPVFLRRRSLLHRLLFHSSWRRVLDVGPGSDEAAPVRFHLTSGYETGAISPMICVFTERKIRKLAHCARRLRVMLEVFFVKLALQKKIFKKHKRKVPWLHEMCHNSYCS